MRPGGARKGAPAHQRPRGRLVRLPGGGTALCRPANFGGLGTINGTRARATVTNHTEIRAFLGRFSGLKKKNQRLLALDLARE